MDEEGGESANYAGPENGLRNSQSEAGGFTAQIRYNTDMADLIRDMGYSCTASADVFREAIKVSFFFFFSGVRTTIFC